jgi:hypothetical protein
MKYNYAVFILTHGRPNSQKTLRLLRRRGYTGKIYLICDDEDKALEEYKKRYKDMVLVFSKKEYYNKVDTMDAGGSDEVVLFARRACFDFAKQLNLDYFVMLDDDYTGIGYNAVVGDKVREKTISGLDKLFQITLDLLNKTNALTIAYAQGGDFVGGKSVEKMEKVIKRKAMNWFFFKTNRFYEFLGRFNEDVNAYVRYAMLGELVFTLYPIIFHQEITQKQRGGMSESYLELGTYVKSFYSVMLYPCAVKISVVGYLYPRIHHSVLWEYCAPKIISEKYRKI